MLQKKHKRVKSKVASESKHAPDSTDFLHKTASEALQLTLQSSHPYPTVDYETLGTENTMSKDAKFAA